MAQSFSHINEAWAYRLMKHLESSGVQHICIAPGSRSAPLTLAAENYSSENSNLQLHSHFDERGLAFFALGIAKSTRRPVAIITTSGTAVANLMPAVIEAYQSRVPLLILTADRPDELINCGANQAIQQKHIFGINVLASCDLPTPDISLKPIELDQYLEQPLSLLPYGPVHINCPFRDPLYGLKDSKMDLTESKFWRSAIISALSPTESAKLNIDYRVIQNTSTILFIGNIKPDNALQILHWAEQNRLPVIADISSGLRQYNHANLINYPELMLATEEGKLWFEQFNQIIQFGGRFVGRRLNHWLGTSDANYCIVGPTTELLDPHHKAAHIVTDISRFCNQPFDFPEIPFETGHIKNMINSTLRQFLTEDFSEINLVRVISKELSSGITLFAGNSLSIRWLDLFSCRTNNIRNIHCNRGASGIDGLIATSFGIETANQNGTLLLIGDTSALHDLNSLAMAATLNSPLIIVIVNNQGGSIFNLLPVNQTPEINKNLFRCEHSLNFKYAAKMFQIPYCQPASLTEFSDELEQRQTYQGVSIIECCFSEDGATTEFSRLIEHLENL